MHCSPYALGTRAEFRFGHGCSDDRMLLEHVRKYMACACMLWSPYALGTRTEVSYALGPPTELWFGHGCLDDRMLLEHVRNLGLGMDALVTVCPWKTNGIMWFGHGS